jgi:drug/metabolite transporter (DMT)-like permease
MPPASRQRLAAALVWITPALWSSNYVIARAANGVVSAHVLALGRWTLALLLMLPWVWRDAAALRSAWCAEWPQMLVLGGLGMWVCGAFVYLGAQSTSATNIGLIYAATPVGIAVAGRWLLHEAGSRTQRLAMAMALLGVLFVIAKGDLATLAQVRFARGDLWIVAAALSWLAYSVLQQRWPSALGTRQRLACITFGGLLVLLPFTAIEVACETLPPFSGQALLLIGLAAVLPGFLSYQAYGLMLRELGATRAGVVMYLSPVYAAFTAWWFLNEAPHWFHAVGAALILPSIHLATRGPPPQR